MAEFTPISSGQLTAKITAINSTIADLNDEKERLSFRAASGDAASIARLDEIRRQTAQEEYDRGVLQSALTEALRLEAEARELAKENERLKHLDAAANVAFKLREKAARVDAVLEEYGNLVLEIEGLEKAVRMECIAAGVSHSGIVGQSNISSIVISMFGDLFDGTRRQKPLVERMDVAWRHLPKYAKKFGLGQ